MIYVHNERDSVKRASIKQRYITKLKKKFIGRPLILLHKLTYKLGTFFLISSVQAVQAVQARQFATKNHIGRKLRTVLNFGM